MDNKDLVCCFHKCWYMLLIINKLQLSVTPGHLPAPVAVWQMKLNTQMKTSRKPSGIGHLSPKEMAWVSKLKERDLHPPAQQMKDRQNKAKWTTADSGWALWGTLENEMLTATHQITRHSAHYRLSKPKVPDWPGIQNKLWLVLKVNLGSSGKNTLVRNYVCQVD